MPDTDPGVIDRADEPGDFSTPLRRWASEITAAERASDRQAWVKRGKNIVRRYRDHRETLARTPTKFNILWSNVETLHPVIYNSAPKPSVERRWLDDDDVGRLAAQVLERAAMHSIETCDLDGTLEECSKDYLLPGLGCARVRYQPYMTTPVEGEGEILAYEEAPIEYHNWEDVLWSPARRWPEVTWVAFRVYLTRKQLRDRFVGKGMLTKEEVDAIPLDYKEQIYQTSSGSPTAGVMKKACVWEIWDKEERKAHWYAPSYSTKLLDSRDDPLKLEGFFPMPEPLRATTTSDTLIPIPDYVEYQDQAIELDVLTMRVSLLVKALRVVGIYDSSVEELQQLLASGQNENKMIPVKNWPAIVEKGGLAGVVDFVPLEEVVNTLMSLYDARDRVKATLYEVTGIADIVRGQTDPNETLGAQQLKGKWVGLRTGKRQKKVARFARDLVRLQCEVIGEHFNASTLRLVSGISIPTRDEQAIAQRQIAAAKATAAQAGAAGPTAGGLTPPGPPPGPVAPAMGATPPASLTAAAPAPQSAQAPPPGDDAGHAPDDIPEAIKKAATGPTWEDVIAVLRSDKLRSFKISIETDSTVAADQEAEQKGRTELVGAIGDFLEKAIPFGQQFPDLAPLIGELVMFVVRGWKIGRPLEQAFEDAMKRLEEAAEAAKNAPPKPDPAAIEAQANANLATARAREASARADKTTAEAQHVGDKTKIDATVATLDGQRADEESKARIEATKATALLNLVKAGLAARGHSLDEAEAALDSLLAVHSASLDAQESDARTQATLAPPAPPAAAANGAA